MTNSETATIQHAPGKMIAVRDTHLWVEIGKPMLKPGLHIAYSAGTVQPPDNLHDLQFQLGQNILFTLPHEYPRIHQGCARPSQGCQLKS